MRSNTLPDFLIIGAMRSGTTSLAHYLSAHPEVFIAPQKEVHYFDVNYEKGEDWYRQQFSQASAGQVIGEASPTYMYDPEVSARMFSLLPEARLIAILRNPVDRAYSHYWHNRALGRETLEFAEAVVAESERLYTSTDVRTLYRYSYLERGHYLPQLLRICNYYPRAALQVILFEDLSRNPVEIFHSVCRFLKVDEQFTPSNLGVTKNAYTTFRSVWLRNFLRDWRDSLIKRIIGRLNKQPKDSYPPLDSLTRAKLVDHFAEDNAALASWLGRDLAVWQK
jgi:hypothetical protein